MSINERIKIIIERLEGGNQRAFAKATDISTSVVASYMPDDEQKGKRVSEPSYGGLVKILTTYPQLSIEWLMFNKGDIFREMDITPSVGSGIFGSSNWQLHGSNNNAGADPQLQKDLQDCRQEAEKWRNKYIHVLEELKDSK